MRAVAQRRPPPPLGGTDDDGPPIAVVVVVVVAARIPHPTRRASVIIGERRCTFARTTGGCPPGRWIATTTRTAIVDFIIEVDGGVVR